MSKTNYKYSIVLGAVFWIWLFPVPSDSQDLSFLADTTHYLWPTDASTYISSTFAETRSAHFHAGIDIRTWGREGYRVFATRDGIVERIAIGPDGYGKVIFLRHYDDSYSIYAHLNRFEESLMAVADSIRLQDYSFLLDRNITHKNIRYKQGDVIGFTGSTGVGPPHLHFELRTPNNEPFNPLLTNIGVDDDIPPVISNVAIEHLDPVTLRTTRVETNRAQPESNAYSLGTFHAEGPVGISVDVHDRANRTPNVYAVYSLTLIHEQDTLFHSKADAFDYRNASQLFIDRVFPLLRERRQGFQRLFVVNGNELTFYKTGKHRGIVDLPEGNHELQVIAADYYGNRSVGTLNLNITDRTTSVADKIKTVPAYSAASGELSDNKRTIYAGPLHKNLNPARLHENNRSTPGPSEDDSGVKSLIYFNKDDNIKSARKKLVPGKNQILHLPDQTIWIEFPENALFDTLHAGISVTSNADGLPLIQFEPDLIPLKSKAYISILMHNFRDDIRPAGLYTYNQRRNRYTLVSSASNGAILKAEITELRDLYVKTDTSPPYIGRPTLTENLGGVPVIHLPAVDEMSGIDYLNSKIEVNGERGIVEYDRDKNRLTFYKPGFEPLENNTVEVRIYDGVGNETHRVFENIRQ